MKVAFLRAGLLTSALLAGQGWAANSSHFELDYSAVTGGGGSSASSGFQLQASAVGFQIGADPASTGFQFLQDMPVVDQDGDGLDTAAELYDFNTNPDSADSDGDNLTDPEELTQYGTDPTAFDTDADGWSDGQEVAQGTDPLVFNAQDAPRDEDIPLPFWAYGLLLGLLSLTGVRRSGKN